MNKCIIDGENMTGGLIYRGEVCYYHFQTMKTANLDKLIDRKRLSSEVGE